MGYVRAIIGIILILFGAYIIILNFIRQFNNAKKKDGKYSSPAPFIGPLCIVIGYAILPIKFSWLIFLAFVIDPDTIIIIASIPFLIKEFIKHK